MYSFAKHTCIFLCGSSLVLVLIRVRLNLGFQQLQSLSQVVTCPEKRFWISGSNRISNKRRAGGQDLNSRKWLTDSAVWCKIFSFSLRHWWHLPTHHERYIHHIKTTVLPDDTPPGGSVQIVLLLRVQPDVLLLVQLKPVHQALPVPTYRLQTHLLWILLVNRHLELEVVVELTLTKILQGGQNKHKEGLDGNM